MRYLLPIIILFCASFIFGQNNCPMPALQKIMPGMTLAQTEKITKRKFTLLKSNSFPNLPKAKAAIIKNFGDTQLLSLDLYDNQIIRIAVIYKEDIEWNGLRDFAETSVKALDLPLSNLRINNVEAFLTCSSVFLFAEKTLFGYRLAVTDTEAVNSLIELEREQKKRLEEAKKKKKTIFRP